MPVVSNPVRFAWNNLITASGVTIAASSAETALPATNVKNQRLSKVWRTTATGFHTLDITFDSAKSIQQAVVNAHNLPSGATISLVGATNSSFSPEGTRLGLTHTTDLILGEFANAQSYQFWRLEFGDGSNPDGYTEIGHVFLGGYDEFDFPDFSAKIRRTDPSTVRGSYDNILSGFEKTQIHRLDIEVSPLQQADRRSLDTIYATNGILTSMYVFLDPNNLRDNEDASAGLDGLHRFTYFCTFDGELKFDHMSLDWHKVDKISLREAR